MMTHNKLNKILDISIDNKIYENESLYFDTLNTIIVYTDYFTFEYFSLSLINYAFIGNINVLNEI